MPKSIDDGPLGSPGPGVVTNADEITKFGSGSLPPGGMLHEGSSIEKQELVRLTLQALCDMGYT